MHAEFIRKIEYMRTQLGSNGHTEKLAKELSTFAAEWLIKHIKNADHKYCLFFEKGICSKN